MAIKNRNGEEYKLTSHNPIMAEMSIWDKKNKLIFHNSCGKAVNQKTPKLIEKPPEEVKTEIPIIDTIAEPESEFDSERIQVWCHPAKEGGYDKKFIFEAIMGDNSDFSIVLYTTTDAVTEGSVIFPKTYDKRWWKVSEVVKGEDGLTHIIGVITDYQPEFS